MKVFKNLTIHVSADRTPELIAGIESRLDHGWWRDHEAEKRGGILASSEHYFFSCDARGNRHAALLAMFRGEANSIYVSNIVPSEETRLDHDQYNAILDDFCSRFIGPTADQLGVAYDLSSDTQQLEDWLSGNTATLLRRFSSAANKSTGSAHSSDRERWYDFILAVYQQQETITTSQLERWLTEKGGWSSEAASELAIEFEFAIGLLDHQTRSNA